MSDEKARVEFPEGIAPEPFIDGRNGCFSIAAMEAWRSSGYVHVDGIGKSGRTIRGGFTLPPEAMDQLAMRWLQARGIVMPAK